MEKQIGLCNASEYLDSSGCKIITNGHTVCKLCDVRKVDRKIRKPNFIIFKRFGEDYPFTSFTKD